MKFKYQRIILIVLILTASLLSAGQQINSISNMENPRLVIKKKARLLQIFDGNKLVKTYKIAFGFAPQGDKEIEGDGKTPEGEFYIFTKNPNSRFYLSLGLSYPNIKDAHRGLQQGIISREEYDEIAAAIAEKRMPPQNTKLGGEIYIHGGGIASDWTAGCIALDDEQVKEIFDVIYVGAEVRILP